VNPYRKGTLAIICTVALGLMLVGGMQVALEVAKYNLQKRRTEEAFGQPARGGSASPSVGTERPKLAVGHCVLFSIPFLVGLGLLVSSSALANRLTEDFEE
jgi:hypothetical protein